MRLLCLSACLAGCAATAVVAPGHRAVVTNPDGALRVVGEGEATIDPAAQVDDFDLRQQTQAGSFTAHTSDGVPVLLRDPVVSWTFIAAELPDAARQVGPAGARVLVASITQAAIAAKIAEVRWENLDADGIRAVQSGATDLAARRLRRYHIALDSVDLKGLVPRLAGLARSVTATSLWQQNAERARTDVELARERAARQLSDAAGLADANRRLDATLTPTALAERRNAAWQKLLAAPTTTVDVADHLEVAE